MVLGISGYTDIPRHARTQFGDMAKAVVDMRLHIMAIGGELRAAEQAVLPDQGSRQSARWGINLYAGPRSATPADYQARAG